MISDAQITQLARDAVGDVGIRLRVEDAIKTALSVEAATTADARGEAPRAGAPGSEWASPTHEARALVAALEACWAEDASGWSTAIERARAAELRTMRALAAALAARRASQRRAAEAADVDPARIEWRAALVEARRLVVACERGFVAANTLTEQQSAIDAAADSVGRLFRQLRLYAPVHGTVRARRLRPREAQRRLPLLVASTWSCERVVRCEKGRRIRCGICHDWIDSTAARLYRGKHTAHPACADQLVAAEALREPSTVETP